MERIVVNTNCPNCGNLTIEGFACCFDCGEVFVDNAMQLVPAEATKLKAGKDYKTTIELDKIIIKLSKKYGREETAYLEWNGAIYVIDGQKPDLIVARGNNNKNILRLAEDRERWKEMIGDFRSLRRDLKELRSEALVTVNKKFTSAFSKIRIGEEERSIINKPTFSALRSVSAVMPNGDTIEGLTLTIQKIRSFI